MPDIPRMKNDNYEKAERGAGAELYRTEET
jgi:hypothetical protein